MNKQKSQKSSIPGKKSEIKSTTDSKDLENIKKRIEVLEKHLSKNVHDYSTKKALFTLKARAYALKRYYERKNR